MGRGFNLGHVAINASSTDLQSARLGSFLAASFERNNVPLKHVVLEVTEAVYMGQRDSAVSREIAAVRAKGVRIALDDFGTGFASLTPLLTVPVDIIKIDRSFVDRLRQSQSSDIIVEALLWIANTLKIGVVAEGIETLSQLNQLREFGCVFGQGYVFSRPVDRSTLMAMLSSSATC
jgi:EAL domain-containing protein (putative c-di-GMP-specific phosphodiesterase class I)